MGRGAFGLLAFLIGALTLGGASESVKKYVFDHVISDNEMPLKMGLSYLVAFIAAVAINTKDFYDLWMVHLPKTIRWIRYERANSENKTRAMGTQPVELMINSINLRARTALIFWSMPKQASYEAPHRQDFDTTITHFRGHVRRRAAGAGDTEDASLLGEEVYLGDSDDFEVHTPVRRNGDRIV